MANQRELQILLELKDNASKELKGFQGRLQKLQPTFSKMAKAGTAAFAGISAGVAVSVQEAAQAEGAWNKFNTVFKDGSDDMKDFIGDLRQDMPVASSRIARMAADLQDLLVPMGLARDEAQGLTQQSLELANKIAAFNDVDPTEVLEAMRSGFVGMSEPLRRFGVDARVSALEAVALEEGLIEAGESFKSLDPAIRQSVQAQALMIQMQRQSADAIEGFEENQDSFLRRWQDLKATFTEVKETIGMALMPVLDELQKELLPIIKSVADWIKENPKLTKKIIIAAGAISGLVAVVGTLGLVIPKIISGFGLLVTAAKGLGTALMFLAANPIGLTITAIAALVTAGVLLYKNWDKVKKFLKDTWDGIKLIFKSAIDWIMDKLQPLIDAINKVRSIGRKVGGAIGGAVKSVIPGLAEGGIVREPTLAMVGEAGPEAVVPLNRASGVGGKTVVINVKGGMFLDRQSAQRIMDELGSLVRSEMRL